MNSNGYIKMQNVQRHQSPRDLTLEEDLMCHIASLKIYSEDLSLVDCFDIQDTLILHVNRQIGTYFMRLDVLQRFTFHYIFADTYAEDIMELDCYCPTCAYDSYIYGTNSSSKNRLPSRGPPF